jgi:hypothetical protein
MDTNDSRIRLHVGSGTMTVGISADRALRRCTISLPSFMAWELLISFSLMGSKDELPFLQSPFPSTRHHHSDLSGFRPLPSF